MASQSSTAIGTTDGADGQSAPLAGAGKKLALWSVLLASLGALLTVINVLVGGAKIFESCIAYHDKSDRFEITYLTAQDDETISAILKKDETVVKDPILNSRVAANDIAKRYLQHAEDITKDCVEMTEAQKKVSADAYSDSNIKLVFAFIKNAGGRTIPSASLKFAERHDTPETPAMIYTVLEENAETADKNIRIDDLGPQEGILFPLAAICTLHWDDAQETFEFAAGKYFLPKEIEFESAIWGSRQTQALRGANPSPYITRIGVESRG